MAKLGLQRGAKWKELRRTVRHGTPRRSQRFQLIVEVVVAAEQGPARHPMAKTKQQLEAEGRERRNKVRHGIPWWR